MDKSEIYDKIVALFVSVLTFVMPLVDMFLVAAFFVLLAFVMDKEAEKKEAREKGVSYMKVGFWRGLKKVLKITFFRGLFVAAAYAFDYFVASKFIYPLLQDKIHPGIDYVITMLVLAGTCWHYFMEADRDCKRIYNVGVIESFSILFEKIYQGIKKLKEIFNKE